MAMPMGGIQAHQRPRLVLALLMLWCSALAVAAAPSDMVWLADQNGCKVLEPQNSQPTASDVTWSGSCLDGYAQGTGELAAMIGDTKIRFVGEVAAGRLVSGELRYGNVVFEGKFADDNRNMEGTITASDGTTLRAVFGPRKVPIFVEKTWPNGSRAEGDIDPATGFLEGEGKFHYADGGEYEGTFMDDKRHGLGVMKYADGTVYEGWFVAGEPQGKGKETSAKGDVYEGEFVSGDPQGKGELRYATGAVYKGDFVSGKRHGHGTYTSADGGTYEGDYVDGKRHGTGRYVDKYTVKEGEWQAGELDGKCKIEKIGKSRYDGTCANGERVGSGHYEDLIGGLTYDGEFRADRYNGKGRLSRKGPDGTEMRYEGTFVNGGIEGQGVLTAGPLRLEGEFKANILYRGRIQNQGRTFEIDLEKGTTLEVLPDGSTRPVTDVPEFRL